LLREPEIDFELPQNAIPDKMSDLWVLERGAMLRRVIVTPRSEDRAPPLSGVRDKRTLFRVDSGAEEDADQRRNRRFTAYLARVRSTRVG
jgi:hypothetical protein